MYCILMDSNTGTYYMDPGDVAFHAYSDVSKLYSDTAQLKQKKKNSRLVETDIEDLKELETVLYNAGFFKGYIDGKPHHLSKQNVYYYDRNPNEISFAQYLLTEDEKYLELIKKPKLHTLCRIDGESVFFPMVTTEDGKRAVLTYTDRSRMPKILLEKYDGWRNVRMTFDEPCVVNGTFVAE